MLSGAWSPATAPPGRLRVAGDAAFVLDVLEAVSDEAPGGHVHVAPWPGHPHLHEDSAPLVCYVR